MATQATLDEAKIGAFVNQVLGELGATLNAALVVIGDKLGLYEAMAESGPITPGELAERTGTTERYVREWLNGQAAGGYVEYDPDDRTYTLPPEHAFVLANENSPYYMPGAFELVTASVRDEPKIREAFQSGAGVGWHEHNHGVFDGCERFFHPGYGYDLVCMFDCLHDMGDPVGAARHVKESLHPDGTWLIVEPMAGDRVEDNLNPVGRVYYGGSTLLCTPASLSQEVGLALGAQAGEARLRDVVTSAGFTRFRRAAETPFNIVLEARP